MYIQEVVQQAVYGDGENRLIQGDGMNPPRELSAFSGLVQCVYLDPPFMTGDTFARKRPYGEAGWKKGTPALTLPGYRDRFADEADYLAFLRAMVSLSRDLLRPEGTFYLHLDWRMSARARILCDEIFGRDRFLNEIIWAYESGGRSKRNFPRKHDTILMYTRSQKYHFDLTRVPLERGEHRKNHMARAVDEDGRAYSYIRSGGKIYRYYDDEPVYPGDVWTDLSILQQKDPERNGYPTQKPLKLLDRLLRPVVQPGDWVADLCCGSGTTLAAAEALDCHFLGMDASRDAISVCQSRLASENLTVLCPTDEAPAPALVNIDPISARLQLQGLQLQGEPYPENVPPLDLIEAWETGKIQGDTFLSTGRMQRSFAWPGLQNSLPVSQEKMPDLLITDAAGLRRTYRWVDIPS